jgi:hypothetical protein
VQGGSGAVRPRMDIAATRAITQAILALDEVLDPAVRRQVLLLLPRDIAVGMPVADDARLQVLNWVRVCARSADGSEALLAALEMVASPKTAEFVHVVDTIASHWPSD